MSIHFLFLNFQELVKILFKQETKGYLYISGDICIFGMAVKHGHFKCQIG